MTFRWLPESERYAHPRLAWLLQLVFDVVVRRLFRVEHDLPPEFVLPPGTLVVSNHLRDSDAPILGSLLYRRVGLRMHGRLVFFVMREDLFERGGLANLLYACPQPIMYLLRRLPLRWFFALVRTLPMRRLREFTWHDTLRELVRSGQGELSPAAVFNARGLRELHTCLGTVPARVDAIDPWRLGRMRVACWGLRRLALPALRQLAPGFRAVVARQLQDLARRLDDGSSVYLAPEGHISMDGRFGRIRAGTWQLGRMCGAPLRCLPLAISYDPLGPGHARAIVRVGTMLTELDVADSRALAHAVRRAIIARRVVTPSHLLARFLAVHTGAFATAELVAWLDRAKAATRAAGVELDPVFARMTTGTLVAQRLPWLRRKRLVSGRADAWRNLWTADTPPGWMRPDGIVRYLANALADFSPELAKTLS